MAAVHCTLDVAVDGADWYSVWNAHGVMKVQTLSDVGVTALASNWYGTTQAALYVRHILSDVVVGALDSYCSPTVHAPLTAAHVRSAM